MRHTNVQQIIESGCKKIAVQCVQRSLYLNDTTNDYEIIKAEVVDGVDGQTIDMLERCMTTCGRDARTVGKIRSRARKKASVQEIGGCYKQFALTNILSTDPG